MSLTTKYQGEEIPLGYRKWVDAEKTIKFDLDSFDDVIIRAWTSPDDIKIFALNNTTNKLPLTRDDIHEVSGKLPASLTKTMRTGVIQMEVFTEINGLEQSIIKSSIYILEASKSKAEV